MASKILITLVAIIGLAVANWLIAPLFYNTAVNEALPSSTTTNNQAPLTSADTPREPLTDTTTPAATQVSGTFTDADSFHQGSGTVRLLEVDGKTYVRFEDDFSVTNGPDLFVHFGKDGQYTAEANLGKLKGNIGSQNYEVPADLDPSLYNEIWIWCRAFSVPFTSAKLQ